MSTSSSSRNVNAVRGRRGVDGYMPICINCTSCDAAPKQWQKRTGISWTPEISTATSMRARRSVCAPQSTLSAGPWVGVPGSLGCGICAASSLLTLYEPSSSASSRSSASSATSSASSASSSDRSPESEVSTGNSSVAGRFFERAAGVLVPTSARGVVGVGGRLDSVRDGLENGDEGGTTGDGGTDDPSDSVAAGDVAREAQGLAVETDGLRLGTEPARCERVVVPPARMAGELARPLNMFRKLTGIKSSGILRCRLLCVGVW